MTMDTSKLKARLDALRRRTMANGCTEAEALAAADKAAELLASSGMTDIELDAQLMEELHVDLGTRRSPLVTVFGAVAKFADCQGFVRKHYGRWTYVYFGNPSDVLVAEYVHEVAKRAADTAIREFRRSAVYQRRRTPKTRAHALRAFVDGFALGLGGKIIMGLWRRKGVADRPHEERQALLTASLAPVTAELARRGVELTGLPALKVRGGQFKHEARGDGYGAGRSVNIEAPLSGAGPGPALLTHGDRS